MNDALDHEHAPDPRAEELEARIAALEAELRESSQRSSTTRRRLERELGRADALARARERALAEALAERARLQGRLSVRMALRVAAALRTPIVTARGLADAGRRARRRSMRALGIRRRPAGRPGRARRQAEVEAAIVAALPQAPSGSGRVTVIIETRTNAAALRSCLASLEKAAWDDLEILVAGPQADSLLRAATDGDQRTSGGRRRVRPASGSSPADSRRAAFAVSSGELVVFLHDDVRPLEPGWLARMVATLRDEDVAAVGARLLSPAGDGDPESGGGDVSICHLGLEFVPVDGIPTPSPVGFGADPLGPGVLDRVERPAASEACLLVRRAVIDEVGLPDSRDPAAEPVELCLRLRAAGHRIVVDGSAVLWHAWAAHEAADHPAVSGELTERDDRWGPGLHRAVLLDQLFAAQAWTTRPLHVGITLTRDDASAGYGDWYTAHELGDAIARLGWRVSYLERHHNGWYDEAPACDVIISLLEHLDLFRVPRHVVTVAWIRNWTEKWIEKPWFENYDVVLVSSGRSKAIVEERSAKVAHVFPIATNPERFHPRAASKELASDAVFVGSSWGVERGVALALPKLAAEGHRVRVFGRGWEGHPAMGELSGGLLAYDDIPDVYASTSIAVDDAAVSTKPYGSVNSRVFDALATGTLVVSDNAMGVHELFGAEFPTWENADDLVAVVGGLLADPARRSALAERFRGEVLGAHTYDHRAVTLRSILAEWVAATRIAIHIGPTTWESGANWGDIPFGRDLQRNFERRGHPATVLVHAEQVTAAAIRADIAIHVFGVRAPQTIGSQVSALWVISHPDRVTEALCEMYDVVFVASPILLDSLSRRVEVPVLPLHQATEPTRFYPDPTGPPHQLLFVGNSRGVQRPIIEDLRDSPWDLAVYGGGWTPEMLDPRHLRDTWVPNTELRRFYSSADVVLNDHWSDMRELGIISNRVYDALACGAFVVSDLVPGIAEEFDGAVATCETRDELHALLERYLADPAARREAAERGRAAVLERHTFALRADRILEVLGPIIAERSREIAFGKR